MSNSAETGKTSGGKSRKAVTAARLAPLAAASVLLCFAVLYSRCSHENAEQSIEGRARPDTVITIGPEVLNSLREISYLDVLSMDVSQSLNRQLYDDFFSITIGEIGIEAGYNFVVTAGTDLSSVSEQDIFVDYPGNFCRITVTIPWPEITGICIAHRNYSVSESTFFRRSTALVNLALGQMDTRAYELVRTRALEMGIIAVAADSARLEIEGLLETLGADIAVVRFR